MTATRTFSFSVYQRAKHTLDGWIAELTGSSPLAIANGRGAVPTGSTMLCFAGAGAVSGAFAAPITSTLTYLPIYPLAIWLTPAGPFELTKNFAQISNIMLERSAAPQSLTELCVDGRGQAHGALRMARELVRQRGVRILYAGFRLHMRE